MLCSFVWLCAENAKKYKLVRSNSTESDRCAARRMLLARAERYSAVPWFRRYYLASCEQCNMTEGQAG